MKRVESIPTSSSWRGIVSIGSIVAFASFFFLAACGDDDSSFAPRDDESSSSIEEESSSSVKDVILSSSEGSSESKSSSSSAKSSSAKSSSSAASSSSVPEGYVYPSTVVVGSMTDSRDGQTYKTVKIGTQIWMAENLNYAYTDVSYNYSDNTSDSTSWCYNDSVEYCVKYGRLYTWAAAMDSAGTWTTNGKGCGYDSEACSPTYPVRGICPEGWHLPSEDEWKRLITAVGGSSTMGQMLKSTGDWNKISGYVDSGNGIDAYSFSALPAGYRNYSGYKDEGRNADFWVSTKNSGYFAYAMSLTSTNSITGLANTFIGDGYSVRCVKDEAETAPE